MANLKRTDPSDWKVKLRRQLLDFFDSVQQKIETIKQFQLKHLQAIIGSMSLDSVALEIKQLQDSQQMLASHDAFLEESFKHANFSTIAARFDQYKTLLRSMEVVSLQSQNLWALVKNKSDQI